MRKIQFGTLLDTQRPGRRCIRMIAAGLAAVIPEPVMTLFFVGFIHMHTLNARSAGNRQLNRSITLSIEL
jgi:hypothetical protein